LTEVKFSASGVTICLVEESQIRQDLATQMMEAMSNARAYSFTNLPVITEIAQTRDSTQRFWAIIAGTQYVIVNFLTRRTIWNFFKLRNKERSLSNEVASD
jgi:hypothetical protein